MEGEDIKENQDDEDIKKDQDEDQQENDDETEFNERPLINALPIKGYDHNIWIKVSDIRRYLVIFSIFITIYLIFCFSVFFYSYSLKSKQIEIERQELVASVTSNVELVYFYIESLASFLGSKVLESNYSDPKIVSQIISKKQLVDPGARDVFNWVSLSWQYFGNNVVIESDGTIRIEKKEITFKPSETSPYFWAVNFAKLKIQNDFGRQIKIMHIFYPIKEDDGTIEIGRFFVEVSLEKFLSAIKYNTENENINILIVDAYDEVLLSEENMDNSKYQPIFDFLRNSASELNSFFSVSKKFDKVVKADGKTYNYANKIQSLPFYILSGYSDKQIFVATWNELKKYFFINLILIISLSVIVLTLYKYFIKRIIDEYIKKTEQVKKDKIFVNYFNKLLIEDTQFFTGVVKELNIVVDKYKESENITQSEAYDDLVKVADKLRSILYSIELEDNGMAKLYGELRNKMSIFADDLSKAISILVSLVRDRHANFSDDSLYGVLRVIEEKINSIRTFNTIRMAQNMRMVSPLSLINTILNMHLKKASKRNIIIVYKEVEQDKELEPIFIDELAVIQIVNTVIERSLFFLPKEKSLFLSLSFEQDEQGNKFLIIIIEDNGFGLSDQERIRISDALLYTSASFSIDILAPDVFQEVLEDIKARVEYEDILEGGSKVKIYIPYLIEGQNYDDIYYDMENAEEVTNENQDNLDEQKNNDEIIENQKKSSTKGKKAKKELESNVVKFPVKNNNPKNDKPKR